jgi:hypothetical protein
LRHKVYAVIDSGNDGNLPENTFDNNFGSRWSSSGDGQWIQYDLGKIQDIGYLGISFMLQSARTTNYEVLVSEDGQVWNQVYNGTTSIVMMRSFNSLIFQIPKAGMSKSSVIRTQQGHGTALRKCKSMPHVRQVISLSFLLLLH